MRIASSGDEIAVTAAAADALREHGDADVLRAPPDDNLAGSGG